MAQTYSLLLYGIAAGAGVVGALTLFSRWNEGVFARAGTVLFVLLACVAAGNEFAVATPRQPTWTIPLHGMLSASLFPAAWLYIRDLLSDTARPITRGDVWHFAVPLAFAPQVIWSAWLLSAGAERSLWEPVPMPAEAVAFAALSLVLSLAWAAQITFYTVRIARELARLPRRLKQVFASFEGRDLGWIRLMLVLLGAHLPLVLAQNLGLLEIPEFVFAAIAAGLSCALSSWAMRQMPVFQASQAEVVRIRVPAPEEKKTKYEKSLLDDARMSRIKAKIDSIMDSQRIYLDANLSLAKLASVSGVTENNLSQTFTRKIGSTFFDYVNVRRIEAAKHLLMTTDTSVTDIALEVGFNARSAFYNAFKMLSGMTPSDYRQSARAGRVQAGADTPISSGRGPNGQ